MAGQDRLCPIELFGQQTTDQKVRPGDGAQGEQAISALQDGLSEPLWATDDKSDRSCAAVTQIAQVVRKSAAG